MDVLAKCMVGNDSLIEIEAQFIEHPMEGTK